MDFLVISSSKACAEPQNVAVAQLLGSLEARLEGFQLQIAP